MFLQKHIHRLGLRACQGARSASALTSAGSSQDPLNAPLFVGGGRSSDSGINAVVFGATGFIGRHVVNALGRIGSQVVVPTRRNDDYTVKSLRLMGDLGQVIPVFVDYHDPDSVRAAIEGSDVVINLVGSHRPVANYSLHDVNTLTAEMIAKSAKECGVRHMVHFSHLGAHPESFSKVLRTKGLSEEKVRHHMPEATILRPSFVFGTRDWCINNLLMAVAGSPKLLIPWGDQGGLAPLSPVDVNDVTKAVVRVLQYPRTSKGRVVECSGPDLVSYKALCDELYREGSQTHELYKTHVLSDRETEEYLDLAENHDPVQTGQAVYWPVDIWRMLHPRLSPTSYLIPGDRSASDVLTLEDLKIKPHHMHQTFSFLDPRRYDEAFAREMRERLNPLNRHGDAFVLEQYMPPSMEEAHQARDPMPGTFLQQ